MKSFFYLILIGLLPLSHSSQKSPHIDVGIYAGATFAKGKTSLNTPLQRTNGAISLFQSSIALELSIADRLTYLDYEVCNTFQTVKQETFKISRSFIVNKIGLSRQLTSQLLVKLRYVHSYSRNLNQSTSGMDISIGVQKKVFFKNLSIHRRLNISFKAMVFYTHNFIQTGVSAGSHHYLEYPCNNILGVSLYLKPTFEKLNPHNRSILPPFG